MGESLEELCRLCAAFDPVKMPIFSSEGKQRNLIVKIQTCLRFKVVNAYGKAFWEPACVECYKLPSYYTNEADLSCIFDDPNRGFKRCFSGIIYLRVAEEDGFPSSVCYRCMFNLENYYDFYETCIRAQTLLQSKIGEGGDTGGVTVTPVIKQEEGGGGAGGGGGIPNAERPIPCDLCPTSFISAKDRWTHVSQNHKGDPRITCIFCRKGFSTISNLNFHKNNKHPEEMEELERKLKPLPKLQKINDIPKIQNKTYETVRNFLNNKTENILQDARHSDLANFNVKIGNTDIKFGNTSITVGSTDIRVGGGGGGGSSGGSISESKANENKSMIDRLKNLGVEVFTGNSKSSNDYNSESASGNEDTDHNKRRFVKAQKMFSSSDEQNSEFQNPEDLLELDLELEGGDNIENVMESESIFGCEVCFRDFKDRSSLWLHMLYSHKVEAGCTCGICLKLFTSYQELLEHALVCKDQMESEKRRYYCKICYRQHDSKKKLESHTSIHNLNDDYIRENFDVNNLIASNPTMTEKMKYEDYMEADVSEYSDTYSQELDITNDSTQNSLTGNGYPNAGQQNYYDEVQNYRDQLAYQNFLEGSGHFLESSSFFDNVKTDENKSEMNQGEDMNKFRCDECYRSYETSLQLTKHKYNVHKNPNRLQYRNDSFGNPVYECEYCGQTYESPKQLTKHRYNVHKFPTNAVMMDDSGKSMFSCSECPRAFETPRQLQKHRYNVHKAPRKIPGQPGCDSPSSVESFKPGFHYSSFDCEICGEKSTSKTERWKHCYKQHQNEEKLVCSNEDCKKIMPTENFQREHMNFHAMQGKYPICCEICSKLWTTKMEFWKHVSGVHYSLIGLTCGVCMKMFLTLDELKEHIKTHEPLSEAEFNCDICGRGYSSKPKMTRHRLIHENDPESDEYNILKHTLLKGNKPPPPEKGKYEILNIPKINRNFENDLEIIEVNPDDNGLVDLEHEENPDTLWCDVCPDLTFADLDELRSHRRNIHALYPCDLCPKFYGGVSHLWKHTNRSHKNHPEITCEFCGKTSASRIQLRGHINKNHKEILLGHVVSEGGNPHVLPDPDPTNLNCRRCGREFRIRSLVRRHERTCLTKTNFDPDPTNLNCQKCGKYYPIRSLVRRHEKACLNRIIKDVDPANLNCKVCGKEFPKRSYCRRHERTCGTKKERAPKDEGPVEIQCEWCPKQFNNRRAYASHVDYMHSLVTCDVCEPDEKAQFRSKTDLYNHCKEKHSDHPDLLCTSEKCRRLLRTKADLEKHMRDHKNRDNPPTCEFCADIFKGRKKLRIHMLHQHRSEESRRYICGVCVKVHDDTEKLIAHAYEMHSKIMERDFTCKICAKQYNCNAKVLDHHKNTHDSRYKPCKVCLRIFTDPTLLEEHLKQHAVGDRSINADLVTDHQCMICMESFDSVVLLHEHVKENHPNLRDYSCLICGKKYQSIYTCYDHMENKHGGTYLTCRKCLMLFTDKEEKANHMMTHGIQEELDSLTCTLCRTRNASEEALETHIRESHADLFEELADRNMCLICSKVLKYKYSIFCHVEKQHPNNYCCRVCLMIYKEKDKLDDHVLRLHTRDKEGNPPLFVPKAINKKPVSNKRPKNMCAVCQKIEPNAEALRKHVETEHEFVLSKELTCILCGHTYANRFKVATHVKMYHGPPYVCCRICTKIFDNEDEFVNHCAEHESEVVPKPEKEPTSRRKRKRVEVETIAKRPRSSRTRIVNNVNKYESEEVETLEEDEEEEDEEEEEMEEDENETSVDYQGDVKEEMDEEMESEMEYENPTDEDDDESKIKNEEDDEEEYDEDEDEEDDDEDVDDSGEEDDDDDSKMVSEKDNEDSYVCETVKNNTGNEEFKIKIKHSIGAKDEDDEGKSGRGLKGLQRGEVVRNGEGSQGSKGSGEEKMSSLMGDMKSLTSCGAE